MRSAWTVIVPSLQGGIQQLAQVLLTRGKESPTKATCLQCTVAPSFIRRVRVLSPAHLMSALMERSPDLSSDPSIVTVALPVSHSHVFLSKTQVGAFWLVKPKLTWQ